MAERRIVSLVPSLTELVCELGRASWLLGRTRFCDQPPAIVATIPIVGGTKNPVIEKIVALAPGLVIANREENRREDIETLEAAGLTILLTDPNTVDEAIAMIREVGAAIDALDQADALCREIETALAEVPALPRRPRVFAAVWKEPLMALGGAAYGHDLIERCGAENVFRERPRYPEITIEELRAAEPDLLLFPDEPYPFRETDLAPFQEIAPARIIDGRLLWWYGSRMPAAIRELSAIIAGAAQ